MAFCAPKKESRRKRKVPQNSPNTTTNMFLAGSDMIADFFPVLVLPELLENMERDCVSKGMMKRRRTEEGRRQWLGLSN